MLQTIQEETATNIYLPSPLQGILGADLGQSPSNSSPTGPNKANMNTIFITGEFFGVQRARDMLFQMSLTKVSVSMDVVTMTVADGTCRANNSSQGTVPSSLARWTGWSLSAPRTSRP